MSATISVSHDSPGDAREALEKSLERYAALVERAGYGVYRSSPTGRFIEVNTVLVTMLGYSNAGRSAHAGSRRVTSISTPPSETGFGSSR